MELKLPLGQVTELRCLKMSTELRVEMKKTLIICIKPGPVPRKNPKCYYKLRGREHFTSSPSDHGTEVGGSKMDPYWVSVLQMSLWGIIGLRLMWFGISSLEG